MLPLTMEEGLCGISYLNMKKPFKTSQLLCSLTHWTQYLFITEPVVLEIWEGKKGWNNSYSVRYNEALAHFDKALELDDKNPIIYSNIGYDYLAFV